jgi:hypothetical protein
MDDAPAFLTPAELGVLIGGLTAGDFWRFSEIADPEQRNRAILLALHRSAVRKGLATDGDVAGFLDRIAIGSLTDLFGLRVSSQIPKEDAGTSLQASADTGA